MNLEEYFGLSLPLFPRVAPEAAILRHSAIDDVLLRMRFALDRDLPLTLIAECGCGKSTVNALFARSLDPATHVLVTTSMTTLAPFSLLASLAVQLGLRPRRFKGEIASFLLAHLRGLTRRPLFLIDEAHLLPDASLEDLRLLLADDLERKSPFVLFLVGQPLLRDRLLEPRHFSLAQRIGVRLRLRPLNETEVALFIDGHLRAAGAKKNPFDPAAVTAIFHQTRGIPRLVQNLALHAAVTAMDAGHATIDEADVQQAIVDLEDL